MIQQLRDDISSSKLTERLEKMRSTNVQQVAGLGDDAAWGSMTVVGKVIDQMWVRKGKSTLIILIIGGLPDDADTMNRVRTLAAKIVAKV